MPAIYGFNILKRYVRIMPAYAVMMLYYWKVNPALTFGPFSSETHICTPKSFWLSFIIPLKASITNSILCTGWCWYLAVDFQLYMTIPIICLIVRNNKKLGIMVCSALIAITTILTIIICLVKNIHFLNWDDQKMNEFYYPKSYLRGNVYYMGCLMSYLTMRGPPRKPREKVGADGIEEPLLSLEQQAEKEKTEKEQKERRDRKRKQG